ncbi:NAD(P)/FAD-dependent oxidoreductase [Methanosphaera sp.]|uniref:NAD(P)/FAD-dependent oxidoreductase n=1 Tax=Methanosphaera sp. TaxID=2666342 RepID=UPI0039C32159
MSEIKEVDVLVIGAGPAGSMAGKCAAENGAKTLIIEKKSEIGTPKRCAEGIRDSDIEKLGLDIDERCIARCIDGASIISPNNTRAMFTTENIKANITGVVLERKVFDKHLTMDAIRCGCEVMIKTEATSMKRDSDGCFIVDVVSFQEKRTQIKAKIVIGADGPEGHTGPWAGINTKVPQKEMESGVQYEMTNMKMLKNDSLEFYFGSVAPGGYAWIFPKGYDTANVGIDINSAKAQKSAIEYLNDFIADCYATQDAQIVEINVGGNPLCGVFDEITTDNFMLVGDAAGCVNPVTGGGIDTAIESGMIAGEVAAKAIANGDYSKDALSDYVDYIDEHINQKFKKLIKIRDFIYDELDDSDLDEFTKALSEADFDEFSFKNMLKILMKTSPRKLLKLRKLL